MYWKIWCSDSTFQKPRATEQHWGTRAFKGTSAGLITSITGDLSTVRGFPAKVKDAEVCKMQIDQLITSPDVDATLLVYCHSQIRLSFFPCSLVRKYRSCIKSTASIRNELFVHLCHLTGHFQSCLFYGSAVSDCAHFFSCNIWTQHVLMSAITLPIHYISVAAQPVFLFN